MRKILKQINRGVWPWLLIVAGLLVLPMVAISLFCHPAADDYSFSLWSHEAFLNGQGLIGVLSAAIRTSAYYWRTWQGTYTSCFLMALQPALWGNKYYALAAPLLMAILGGCTLYFSHGVCRTAFGAEKRGWLYGGILLAFYFFQCVPVPHDAFYWYNGAIHYITFASLTLVNAVLLLKAWFRPEKQWRYFVLSALVSFVLSGGNTVSGFGNLTLTAALAFLFCLRRRFGALLPLAAAGAGYALNLFAPGTLYRASSMATLSPVQAVLESLGLVATSLWEWGGISLFILTAALLPFLARLICGSDHRYPLPALFIAGCYCLQGTNICVVHYSLGGLGPGRVQNALFITGTVYFLTALTYGLGWLAQRFFPVRRVLQWLADFSFTPLLVVACMLVLFWMGSPTQSAGTGLMAYRQITDGSAQAYDLRMTKRLDTYLNPDITDAEIPAIRDEYRPSLIASDDLSGDTENWINKAVSAYFGKNTVKRVYYED